MRIAIPAESKNGLDSPISYHFGRCPVFIVVDAEDGEVKSVEEVDNPYYGQHAPGQVPAFIQSQGADVILVGGMGHRALAMFEQYGIEAVTGAGGTVQQALTGFLEGQLAGVEPCEQSRHHKHQHGDE